MYLVRTFSFSSSYSSSMGCLHWQSESLYGQKRLWVGLFIYLSIIIFILFVCCGGGFFGWFAGLLFFAYLT